MEPRDRGTTITDIDIPFGRLVLIIIKVALAAIPAYFVLALILFAVMAVFGMFFGGMGMVMQDTWWRT